MSFEGYLEFLCEVGHYQIRDASESGPPGPCVALPGCGRRMAWGRLVDETNGRLEDQPRTMPGPKEEIGFDDFPQKKDHYGNPYFVKVSRYKPLFIEGGEWAKEPTLEEEISMLRVALADNEAELKIAKPWPQVVIHFQVKGRESNSKYAGTTPLWIGPVGTKSEQEEADRQYEALYHEHQAPIIMFGINEIPYLLWEKERLEARLKGLLT